jgi:hypothetical protein
MLCEAATAHEGLLNVLGGGITRVHALDYPAPIPLTLALLIELDEATPDKHAVDLVLAGEDDNYLGKASLEFGVIPDYLPSVEGSPVTFAGVVPLSALTVPTPGEYVITVEIDDELLTHVQFGSY